MVASMSAWRSCCGRWRLKTGLRAPTPPLPTSAPPPPPPPAAKVAEDLARRVVTRGAAHAAPGMGAGAAHVKPLQRSAVIAVAEHRARREQLIEAQGAVGNVAADEPEGALQIERTHD